MKHTQGKFTKDEIANWEAYEDVRVSGDYNMFSPQARDMAGLSKEEYMFCINNYTELRNQANPEGRE